MYVATPPQVAEIPWRRRRGRKLLQTGSLIVSMIVVMVYLSFSSESDMLEGSKSASAAERLRVGNKRSVSAPTMEYRPIRPSLLKPKRTKLIKPSKMIVDDDEEEPSPRKKRKDPLTVPSDDDEDAAEDEEEYGEDYDEDEDYDDDDEDDDDYDYDDDDDDDDEDEIDFTPLKFYDIDGDRLTFKIGNRGQLCEFVNGNCEVLAHLRRLAKLAYPRVRLRGFPMFSTREVPITNHESIEEAIKSEEKRIANATKALEGMESMLSKWSAQLEEEEAEKTKEVLPTWQRIHLASSTKRRKRDMERLEKDIAAMKKARAYMEETVMLFKSDLNETTAARQLPPLPPCRSVPVMESEQGGWEFNPLHTGNAKRTENPNAFFITIQTPGMEMDDLKVSVKDSTLIVKGAVEQLLEQQYLPTGLRHVLHLCVGGSCVQSLDREFSLPLNADASKISAHMQDGALTVEIPKINAAPEGEVMMLEPGGGEGERNEEGINEG
eukprot:jgi/Bigna1/81230/fgenesh1_pg.78_\